MSRLPSHAIYWLALGAHSVVAAIVFFPVSVQAQDAGESSEVERARQFWAFKTPRKPRIPHIANISWPKTPIDHFILAELQAHELKAASPADKRTLIRRATFDLIGLPPTLEEVAAFLHDDSPDAFEKVVDRLLGSVHYGERWGRHWLDVARYADSNGLDENLAHGNAWRYRDYVIDAFNRDKPYDEFVVEQIAGDLLPSEANAIRHERLVATGFLTLGPKVLAEQDKQKMIMDIVDEQIDTLGRTFMGMTLGCARCHDHKFDPISMRDYYGLAGIMKSTRTMESLGRVAQWHENSIAKPDQKAKREAHDRKIAEMKTAIQRVIETADNVLKAQLPTGETIPDEKESRYSDEVKRELKRLRKEQKELELSAPKIPSAMGLTEGDIADARLHLRGSHLMLGDQVPRGVPFVLAYDGQPTISGEQSGRLELARWLARAEHPLTSRVMVNRIWRWHFGHGLVRSPDYFGALGDRPTNAPLLDWLAVHFAKSGWSIKAMHRLIMLSSTYQMSSNLDAAAARIDPTNRLHWRHEVRRLEAEEIRDSLLSVSGLLDQSMGGSMLHVGNRDYLFDHTSNDETTYNYARRTIYLPVIRNHLYDIFSLFDYPDASVPIGDRPTSAIPPQALFMMNGDLVLRASEALGRDLLSDPDKDEKSRIGKLYLRVLGHSPTVEQLDMGARFLDESQRELDNVMKHAETRRKESWIALCQVILISNEFMHIR